MILFTNDQSILISFIYIAGEKEKYTVTSVMSFDPKVDKVFLESISDKWKDVIAVALKPEFNLKASDVKLEFKGRIGDDQVVIVTFSQKLNDYVADELLEKINEGNFKDEFSDKIRASDNSVILNSASATSK